MKKIYTIFCLGLLFLASCEDLVEVDYPTNKIGTKQVFEDLRTADAALTYLYGRLRDMSLINYSGINALLGSYSDDLDYFVNDQNGYMDINLTQQLETNTVISSLWNTAYQQIYYANSIIYGVQNSTALSGTDKNRVTGEALFIRCLLYFYLQQLFDDIPYTTSLDYEYNNTIGKTEAASVLELLEADLIEAAGLLEDDYRNAERIYINRKTAQLLLARIYLLREKWSLAEQTAETILESPLYEFQTDINEVFHKSGTHILWQFHPATNGNLVASYYYFVNTPNSYTLTENLVNTFDEADLRRQNWVSVVTYEEQNWYMQYKYKDRSTSPDEYFIVFRLEEVYFIMAEALAEQDRVEEALPYLNATRERAGLAAFTSLSYEDFIDELLAEKRREFFLEGGHRFLDLKRFDRLGDLISVKPNWEEHKSRWPLPQSELLLNPNLKPQNPGY